VITAIVIGCALLLVAAVAAVLARALLPRAKGTHAGPRSRPQPFRSS
jgi:hypothetical protein